MVFEFVRDRTFLFKVSLHIASKKRASNADKLCVKPHRDSVAGSGSPFTASPPDGEHRDPYLIPTNELMDRLRVSVAPAQVAVNKDAARTKDPVMAFTDSSFSGSYESNHGSGRETMGLRTAIP